MGSNEQEKKEIIKARIHALMLFAALLLGIAFVVAVVADDVAPNLHSEKANEILDGEVATIY